MKIIKYLLIILFIILLLPFILISFIFKLYKKKVIRRNDNVDYLIRYSLLNCKFFSIKIHNILVSDYDCAHNHPWAFITLLLRGGYVEYTPEGSKVYGAGSLLYRPATYIHKLEIHQPVWSFVITFKKTQPWGFFTSKGWVEWFKYTPSNTCD